ncbi:MAG: flavin reductase [Verrucomicrobia bacterium]|nr:flavin reductase [Cytophagales bacterium]
MPIFEKADFAPMEQRFRTNLINSLSGFKSVNLVGTVNAAGLTNLAIFSQVFHIGANPALMGMLVRPDSVPRHTLANLMETGFFTLNNILEDFYQQAHQTSARYETSEFEACGFTAEFSGKHPAPYVKESTIKIGLKFEEHHPLVINGTILVIGSVQEIICPDDCLQNDGYLDIEKAGSITCSASDGYHTTQKLSRLPYAKV